MSGIVLLVLRFLLTASLYAFLGLALYLLWQDMKRQSERSTGHIPALELLSEDGERSYRFTRPEVNVGRDPSCDCPLEDKTVSTQHARLIYRQHQWWLEDLQSTNGTFLNQEAVSSPIVVTSGDQLRFGQVILNIIIREDQNGRR